MVAVGAEPLAQKEQQASVLTLVRTFLLNHWCLLLVQQFQKCCHRELGKWGHSSLINSSGTVPGMFGFVAGKRRPCSCAACRLTEIGHVSDQVLVNKNLTPTPNTQLWWFLPLPVIEILATKCPSSLTWLRWKSNAFREVLLKGPGLCQGPYA